MMTYQIKTIQFGGQIILRQNDDGSTTSFSINPANTDYIAYLKFLEEGGQPLPADDNGQTS
jgi:hypothetical protein